MRRTYGGAFQQVDGDELWHYVHERFRWSLLSGRRWSGLGALDRLDQAGVLFAYLPIEVKPVEQLDPRYSLWYSNLVDCVKDRYLDVDELRGLRRWFDINALDALAALLERADDDQRITMIQDVALMHMEHLDTLGSVGLTESDYSPPLSCDGPLELACSYLIADLPRHERGKRLYWVFEESVEELFMLVGQPAEELLHQIRTEQTVHGRIAKLDSIVDVLATSAFDDESMLVWTRSDSWAHRLIAAESEC